MDASTEGSTASIGSTSDTGQICNMSEKSSSQRRCQNRNNLVIMLLVYFMLDQRTIQILWDHFKDWWALTMKSCTLCVAVDPQSRRLRSCVQILEFNTWNNVLVNFGVNLQACWHSLSTPHQLKVCFAKHTCSRSWLDRWNLKLWSYCLISVC